MSVNRIEYGIHADNWNRWGMAQAIKEIIANAQDSGADFEVIFEASGKGNKGIVNVSDIGRGFPKDYLMVGAGEVKGRGQIGQFREGLKGAMCVAARNGRRFSMTTTGFSVERVAIEDCLLGPGGFVLYVDFDERSKSGTDVAIEATEAEVRAALRHFNGVRCRGIEIEECKFEGAVAMKPAGRKGKVFINDALACEADTLFDYNFSWDTLAPYGLQSLLEDLKSGQNRDREVVRWEEVENAVRRVLAHIEDPEIIRHFYTAWESGQSNCREYRLHGGISGGAVWKELAKEQWPGKVCQNPSRGRYWNRSQEDEAEWFLSLRDRGWDCLPSNLPDTLRETISSWFPTVSEVHRRLFKQDDEKKMDVVAKKDWTADEKRVMGELQDGLVQCFGLTKSPEFRMYVRHYELRDSVGLWYKGCIWLRRDYLNRAIQSPGSFTDALGTVAHEYAHGRNGHAGDRTRDFERVLTEMLGQLMMKMLRPDAVDVVAPEKIGKETVDLSAFPEVYTFEEIVNEFARRMGRAVKPLEEIGERHAARLIAKEGVPLHYVGGWYKSNKGGISAEYHFAGVDAKGRACHLYFKVPLRGRVVVCGGRNKYTASRLRDNYLNRQNSINTWSQSEYIPADKRPFFEGLAAASG